MSDYNVDNFGFVILCPERNYGGLIATVRSIQAHYPDKPYLCVTVPEADASELSEFNGVCPTFVGGDTYTSLINLGVRENKAEWSYIVMAGVHIRAKQLSRYERFCMGKNSVMYPVVDRLWQFDESTLNGLFLHRQAFEEIGPFDESGDDFQKVRLYWGAEAAAKGYRFISLVGVPR